MFNPVFALKLVPYNRMIIPKTMISYDIKGFDPSARLQHVALEAKTSAGGQLWLYWWLKVRRRTAASHSVGICRVESHMSVLHKHA